MRATAIAAGPAGGPSTLSVADEVEARAVVAAPGLEEIVSVAALPLPALEATAVELLASGAAAVESSPCGALKTGAAPCRVGSGSAGFGFAFTGSGAGARAEELATATEVTVVGSLSPEEASE